jgi:hypothetical protein
MALRLFGDGRIEPIVEITADSPTDVPLTLIGATGQTANLLEVKDDAGAVVAKVEPDGDLFSKDVSATNATFNGTASASTAIVSGNLTVNTNTFVVDSTNNRVGINKTSPSSSLHVVSPGNTTIDGPTSGTWAARIIQQQDQNNFHGLSIHSRWGGTGSKILEVARGWNGSSQGYFPALTVDGSGYVETPYQPGMVLDGNFPNWATYGSPSDAVISAFATEFSRGSISHNGSGRITVSVGGYYLVYYQLYVQGGAPGRANLRVNGADRVVGQFTKGSVDNTCVAMTIVPAAANDYFEIVGTSFDPLTVYMGAKHSFFGCFLIG